MLCWIPISPYVRLPVGKFSFEKIRSEEMFYIDKSGLIEEILKRMALKPFSSHAGSESLSICLCAHPSSISQKTQEAI